MLDVLAAVLPVFALIFLGYIFGKRNILGATATDVLNRFVVYMALPALLFQKMANITLAQLANAHFLGSFGGGMMLTFAICFVLDRVTRGNRSSASQESALTDASIEGMAASYPNTAFMGIPLCLAILGKDSLPPLIISTFLVVCLLMALTLILIEVDRQQSSNMGKTLGKVALSLAKNPILFAPAAGLLVSALGKTLPGPVDQFTTLLGNAASPCALVTIGLFLAEKQPAGNPVIVGRLVVLKLFVQPIITTLLALYVFRMPPIWTKSAILLSALPIGTGPFMLAKLYEREAGISSRAILITTVGSLVTVSLLILWLKHN